MKFALIDAENRRVRFEDCLDVSAARAKMGLGDVGVDFGSLRSLTDSDGRGLSIIVYEYGLFSPEPLYWSYNDRLFHGNAVIFAFDYEGETIDIKAGNLGTISWLGDVSSAERAIAAGKVVRPQSSINGVVLWSWPGALDEMKDAAVNEFTRQIDKLRNQT